MKSSGFYEILVIAPTLHSSNWRVFAETLAFIILGGFHRWNLGELCWISQVKSLVIAPTLHSSNWRVFAETLAFIILGGFHRWNLGEIHQISWLKSTRFQGEIHQISGWNPLDFKGEIPQGWKSFCWNTCFYNFGWISQVISGWNPLDFTGQICQISGWNLVDFMKSLVIAPTLHSWNWGVFAETRFYNLGWISQVKSGWNLPDFMDEIHQISGWNLVDFMKSLVIAPTLHSSNWRVFCWNTCFYNFGWISQVKSGWNPPDFTGEIHQISGWNPLDFKGEIPHPAFIKLKSFCWNTCFYNFGWISQVISWWNPPDFTDFTKSAGFHGEIRMKSVWNPPDFMECELLRDDEV